MRPVQIPAQPARYDEAVVKAQLYNVLTGVNQYQGRAISTVATDLKGLIDLWSANGFAWQGKLRRLDPNPARNTELNLAYDSWWGAVAPDRDYGTARLDLLTSLGAYCSYCELPISAALAVEHRLPKASFPAAFLNWSNFLLACPICNSIKGDTPTQVIDGHDYTTDQATPLLEDRIAWPQAYWRAYADGSLLPFEYNLYALRWTKGGWVRHAPVTGPSLAAAVDGFRAGLGSIQNNAFSLLVTAPPISSPQRAEFAYFAVFVEPRIGLAAPKFERMIGITKLNQINRISDQASTDFRVALRTQAYFRALSLRRSYGVLSDNNAVVPATQDLVLRAARDTGFWGVWLTVFKDAPAVTQAINATFPGFVNQAWIV